MSRIGNQPIQIPDGVEIKISGPNVSVKGPKGDITSVFDFGMDIKQEDDVVKVTRPTDESQDKAFHGLTRSLLANMIIGVSNRKRSGFGRSGGILAWAQLPSNRHYDGQLWSMFDAAEDWTLPPSAQGILFRAVCAHEIGHLLGLGHSQFKGALMYPYYSEHIETPQEQDDIPRIQRLYGKIK